MKMKALILGAPPSVWEGPWIRIDPDSEWLIEPAEDYRGLVEVVTRGTDGEVSVVSLNNEEIVIRGRGVRGVIREGIEEHGCKHVSVNIKERV